MMRHSLLGIVLATALGGCADAPEAPVAIPSPPAIAAEDLQPCNGSGLVRYVGVPLIRPGNRIPDEGAYVSWEDLPVKTRVLGPGVMATMDYAPDRLNVTVDAKGLIRRLYCG
jgi:hypothetical protein